MSSQRKARKLRQEKHLNPINVTNDKGKVISYEDWLDEVENGTAK